MIRRVLAAAVLVVGALFLLAIAWPQLFSLEKLPLIAQAVSMRGLAILCAIVAVVIFMLIALLSVASRRFAASVALVLVAFCALSVVVQATRGFGDGGFETVNESDVTVLTWNTLGDSPEAAVIAALALESNADVVSLPETTEEMGIAVAELMAASGRDMQVLTVAYDLISKARSTTLLVSSELGAYTFDSAAESTEVLPSVVATPVDGGGPTIIAVHSVAPIPGEMANWRTDLQWLSDACASDNVIMAGDFNSTLDHYSGLATKDGATIGRCFDAGVESDNGAVGTWPTMLPALLGSPIDHVMYTDNWRVSGMRVIESHDKLGSDHRPVLVQLSPNS